MKQRHIILLTLIIVAVAFTGSAMAQFTLDQDVLGAHNINGRGAFRVISRTAALLVPAVPIQVPAPSFSGAALLLARRTPRTAAPRLRLTPRSPVS